jgi:hypothetical protein
MGAATQLIAITSGMVAIVTLKKYIVALATLTVVGQYCGCFSNISLAQVTHWS